MKTKMNEKNLDLLNVEQRQRASETFAADNRNE